MASDWENPEGMRLYPTSYIARNTRDHAGKYAHAGRLYKDLQPLTNTGESEEANRVSTC